ncbi:MAG: type II toxin-antitoxin system RelE/ParE family toxin [bacterium]
MSGRYKIFETHAFRRDLSALQAGDRSRIERKLEDVIYPSLRDEPHAGPNIRKLRDWQPETWRYRTGSWRCFYEIDESSRMVNMTAIERRSERTYRR